MSHLTTAELAEMLRTSESTVRYWRQIGYGPRGVRVGRRVLYERSEVARWLRALGDAESGARRAAG